MIGNVIEIPFYSDQHLILLEGSKSSDTDLHTLAMVVITSAINQNPESNIVLFQSQKNSNHYLQMISVLLI
jgi:hypothetical protein